MKMIGNNCIHQKTSLLREDRNKVHIIIDKSDLCVSEWI